MAEFYQETILAKVEVVGGENIFGGLKVGQLSTVIIFFFLKHILF